MDFDNIKVIERHRVLLDDCITNDTEYLHNSPLLTPETLRLTRKLLAKPVFTQYGLLGSIIRQNPATNGYANGSTPDPIPSDARLFYNTMAPSSTFICGSQGSGKSHTLSCLLENSLTTSPAAILPKPLTGLLFHYDTFISDDGGSPCEAAYLASLSGIKVRILCSPTNVAVIKVSTVSSHPLSTFDRFSTAAKLYEFRKRIIA